MMNTLNTKKKNVFSIILVVLLMLAMALEPGLNAFAEGLQEYVSSLKLFIAEEYEDALSECKASGYIPFDFDLNDGSDGCVVMGYQKTSDKSKALTDISILEMKNGYYMLKYKEIAEKQMESLGSLTKDMVYAVSEMKDNLENGSPAAREALATLNIYYIPELDNIALGDYLLSDNFSEYYLRKIICRANTGITYALYSALSSGAADYIKDENGNEENWVTRAINGDVRKTIEEEGDLESLDKLYKERATSLKSKIQEYSNMYLEAQSYVEANGASVFGLDIDKANEDADLELSEDTKDKIENYEQDVEAADKYFTYIVSYGILNQYEWSEGVSFADYLVSLGQGSYTNLSELRALYPLISGLTTGQYALACVTGLNDAILALVNNEEAEAMFYDNLEDIKEDIRAYNSQETLSIWEGVDLTIYEEEVALTHEAQRQMDASGSFDELTKRDKFADVLSEIMSIVSISTSITCVCWFVTTLAFSLPTMISSGILQGVQYFVSANLIKIGVNSLLAGTSSILGSIFAVVGIVVTVAQYICLAAMLIVLIIQGIKWLIDKFTSERSKEALDYTEADIPRKVYDIQNSEYILYNVVTDKNDVAADLNAFEGIRFAALYTTTDTKAGDPITVSSLTDTFVLQRNSTANPAGYVPVCVFGGDTAENLNFYADEEDADQIFLFYNKEGAEGINASTTEKTESQGSTGVSSTNEYLSSILLSTASTPTAAKNRLQKRGYIVLDYNLTPNAEGSYSYIGYKTTTNPNNAIRDIRVSPRTDGSNITFGGATYVLAGDANDGGKTQSGLGIYYAVAASCGTPIYANLLVTDNKDDAPVGWEPVNMFSGGGAYNVNDSNDEDEMVLYREYWDDGVYIYFEPTEKFTSGTEYLGGFTTILTEDSYAEGQTVEDIAAYFGFKLLSDIDIADGIRISRIMESTPSSEYDQNVNIMYSTTYNPYRAIYDIKSYTAAPGTTSLNLAMGNTQTGAYALCDTVFKLYEQPIRTYKKDGDKKVLVETTLYSIGVSHNHSYLNVNGFSADFDDYFYHLLFTQQPDDFMDADWEESETPMLKAFYVQGAVSGKSPLKLSDIVITSDYSDAKNREMNAKGFYSVQDFRTPNREEAHNVGFDKAHPVVIYVQKAKETKGKYISSIALVSWNAANAVGDGYEDYSDDQKEQINLVADNACIVGLVQQVNGEILLNNLALSKNDSWQGDWENEISEVAYIGVSRTNDATDAITSIIKYMPDGKATSPINVDGVSYIKAGDEPVHSPEGDYYIYYSKGTGNPGEPITELSFDSQPIIKNAATVLTANSVDKTTVITGKRGKTQTEYATLFGRANETNYIHCEYETTKTYIDCLYVGVGNTANEAQADLLSMGCNMMVPIDLNQNGGGKYVYLGYSRFTVSNFRKVSTDAIKDIICTVGQDAQDEFEYNGAVYYRAFDKYSYNDKEGAVSLNEGTSGRKIYIYYTTDSAPGTSSPIMTIGAHTRDFVPDNQGSVIWESVLAVDGTRCNLNDGVFGTGEDGHSLDNRIYLFVNRKDNSVKLGGDIAVGNTSSKLKYGSLSFTK